MKFGSLFAGIGGLDLGLERAGMTCCWQVEIDGFCQSVLRRHWPEVQRFADVRSVGGELPPVDLIAGGFPCQDLSVAGRRAGIVEGSRSGLWSEFHRILGVLRPRFVLIENVPGLLANGPMRRVLGDLWSLGYDAQWECLPAAAVGGPHLRDRVWILAYAPQEPLHASRWRRDSRECADLFPERDRSKAEVRRKDWELVELVDGVHPRSATDWWLHQSRLDRSADGIPFELAAAANGAYGNAVVPQVAEYIGRRLMDALGLAPLEGQQVPLTFPFGIR